MERHPIRLVEREQDQYRFFFFINDPATTEIYTTRHTLSLHDALPIYRAPRRVPNREHRPAGSRRFPRSEEHTSELQSRLVISYAVFCLKKKTNKNVNSLVWSYLYKKHKLKRTILK